jgi:hypothetical protein
MSPTSSNISQWRSICDSSPAVQVADAPERIPALAELELTGRAALPGELAGMKQAAMPAACGPVALLLDELLMAGSGGDLADEVTIVARARGSGRDAEPHLFHLVEEICARILVMRRGRGRARQRGRDRRRRPGLWGGRWRTCSSS